MGLVNEIIIETEKAGSDILSNAYFRVPRTQTDSFEIGENYAKFKVEIWKDFETREEVVDGKKPLTTISVWVYKEFQISWFGSANVMIGWDSVINESDLKTFIHSNIIEFGFAEAFKKGFLTQFYTYLKTQNNFYGFDMTTANNHP
jgi:hypothetical protein